jgi:integrase/recombinase XerD
LTISPRTCNRFNIRPTGYAAAVAASLPSLAGKRVSPHTIRHTTATHLLRAGVDINTIRAWLGHVSLNTTNVYAEVDLEMKAKALANWLTATLVVSSFRSLGVNRRISWHSCGRCS